MRLRPILAWTVVAALAIGAGHLLAQTAGNQGLSTVTQSGSVTAGHVVTWAGTGQIQDGGGASGGTVTSVATTAPITGGTFTTSGTIACATCATTTGTNTFSTGQTFNGATSGVGPAPNLVQNGDFLVDQRNEGAALTVTTGTANLFGPDRWNPSFTASTSGAGNPTAQRVALSAGLTGTANELKIAANATPGTTSPAALTFIAMHSIEGPDVQDLGFGAAGASQVTVTLWLKSSIASATYGVALQNSAQSRAFAHNCVVASSATWTKCSFSPAGDTTGTWLTAPGSIGLRLIVTLSCGSTFQQTADTWVATNTYCTSSQTELTNTASATLEIAQVKLERGAASSQFVPEPYTQTVDKLQRYYRKSFPPGTAPATSAGVAGSFCTQDSSTTAATADVIVQFNPPMYASPVMTTFNPSAGNANWRDVTGGTDVVVSVDPATAKSVNGVEISSQTTALTAAHVMCIHYTADSQL